MTWTKEKARKYAREYAKKNKKRIRELAIAWKKANLERHRKNQQNRNKRYYAKHRKKESVRQQNYRATPKGRELHCTQEMQARFQYPERYLWRAAKQRAQKFNVPFTIQVSDIIIPKVCPVFGIPLVMRIGHNRPMSDSPSIDRIIPKLGYVPKNICVISHRANFLKKDGNIEELEALLRWFRSKICP